MELDINYFFAFSHGVVHPLTILYFAKQRLRFGLVIFAIGILTLLEFWLLHTLWGLPFPLVKTVLAVSTAVLGICAILGNSVRSLLGAILVGLLVALVSDTMISLEAYRANWSLMFPLLVAGQLAAYFLGFLLVRALPKRP